VWFATTTGCYGLLRHVVDGWKPVRLLVRGQEWRQQQCCVLRWVHAAVQLSVQAGWWVGGLLMLLRLERVRTAQ
jgi:hypothetical protein